MALVEREVGLGQESVRRIIRGLLIAAPSDRARPNAALADDAMVGCGRSHAIHVDSWTAIVSGFSLGQMAARDLERPPSRGQEPATGPPRTERAGSDS